MVDLNDFKCDRQVQQFYLIRVGLKNYNCKEKTFPFGKQISNEITISDYFLYNEPNFKKAYFLYVL